MKALLEDPATGLPEALALKSREHLAFVGGGGKTTLMFALAGILRARGKRVLTTTTTRVWQREAGLAGRVLFTRGDPDWREKLIQEIERSGHLFLAEDLLDSGKVKGIDQALADDLYRDPGIDYLLVEADGSAGRPVKVPALHEPVVPSSVTKVIAMAGLEAIGKKAGPDLVFRFDLFRSLTGLEVGQELTPSLLARIFLDPLGLFKGAPGSSERVVFLNKSDLMEREEPALQMADLLTREGGGKIERVIIASLRQGRHIVCKAG